MGVSEQLAEGHKIYKALPCTGSLSTASKSDAGGSKRPRRTINHNKIRGLSKVGKAFASARATSIARAAEEGTALHVRAASLVALSASRGRSRGRSRCGAASVGFLVALKRRRGSDDVDPNHGAVVLMVEHVAMHDHAVADTDHLKSHPAFAGARYCVIPLADFVISAWLHDLHMVQVGMERVCSRCRDCPFLDVPILESLQRHIWVPTLPIDLGCRHSDTEETVHGCTAQVLKVVGPSRCPWLTCNVRVWIW
mmetsp:Transcript_6838/g.17151  ORF Transcript_6838/g.17151 Transcript_6838/m.17151 type:complete len:253 (+) Transcript_6838:57-815(+)